MGGVIVDENLGAVATGPDDSTTRSRQTGRGQILSTDLDQLRLDTTRSRVQDSAFSKGRAEHPGSRSAHRSATGHLLNLTLWLFTDYFSLRHLIQEVAS